LGCLGEGLRDEFVIYWTCVSLLARNIELSVLRSKEPEPIKLFDSDIAIHGGLSVEVCRFTVVDFELSD
jgi:hypothetical protein